jgi:urea carboxylase
VWRVGVAEGDEVVEGESVVVLEAMKMETAVAAPASGRVREVRAAAGQVVTGGQVLVVLDPAGGS